MKKRGLPTHLQKPIFSHQAAEAPFVTILEKVPDPRGPFEEALLNIQIL